MKRMAITRALRFYRKHTKEELVVMLNELKEDKTNLAPPDSLFILAPKARKKHDDIVAAITMHLRDDRERSGQPVPCSGYSGRKQNRR